MSEWISVKDEKPLKPGYMRVYSFKPEKGRSISFPRHYEIGRAFGQRKCDLYIDIPIPDEPLED